MSLLDALLLDPAPFEVWVAVRTDGVKGSGTASDPYDGSTQAKFDAVMNLFAAQSNVTVHLGPGTFETNGYADGAIGTWQARPGMKVMGSGMEITTLKLVNVSPGSAKHYFAIGHALTTPADFCEVRDLTIDGNIANANANAACGGVRVMGNHARIERVKVKNWGTKSASMPCFALSVITAYPDTGPTDMVNAGVEDCVVTDPYNSNAAPATALNVGSQNDLSFTKEGHAKSPYIRNCFVDCGVTTPNPDPATGKYRGISMGWCRGGVVEGNHIYNTDIGGPYQDQRSVRDVIVRNNFFKNVARGPYLNLGQLGSSLGSGTNNFSRAAAVATITGIAVANLTVGDRVRLVTSPGDFTGVYQIRTVQASPDQFTVGVADSGPATASVSSVQRVLSVGRAIIEGNIVELATVSGAVAGAVADNNDSSPYAEAPDYAHGDVIVRNNKIRYVDGATPNDGGATLVEIKGAKSLIVQNNVLDTVATSPLANRRCGNATYFNNRTPSGALIEGFNPETVRRYAELETDTDFALVLSLFNRKAR